MPVMIDEKYRTNDVILLIRRCLDEGWANSPTLPILADALEDAGFSDIKTLVNLRTGSSAADKDQFIQALGIPEEILGGSWDEVFAYAGEKLGMGHGCATIRPAKPGAKISLSPFQRYHVVELLGSDEGVNDEQNWLVYGKLADGRFFFLTAGCDYTGWG